MPGWNLEWQWSLRVWMMLLRLKGGKKILNFSTITIAVILSSALSFTLRLWSALCHLRQGQILKWLLTVYKQKCSLWPEISGLFPSGHIGSLLFLHSHCCSCPVQLLPCHSPESHCWYPVVSTQSLPYLVSLKTLTLWLHNFLKLTCHSVLSFVLNGTSS